MTEAARRREVGRGERVVPGVWRLRLPLPDRGLGMARIAGLLALAFIAWLPAALKLWTFSRLWIVGVYAGLLVLGGRALWAERAAIRAWARQRRGAIICSQLIYALAFGLLLLIRDAMAPLHDGGVLEVRSREISVKEDLPAWCRMVGHELLSVEPAAGSYTHFRIAKKAKAQAANEPSLHRDLEQARNFAWTARVRWTSGMQARAFVRNHAFTVGQPASFDTEDAAVASFGKEKKGRGRKKKSDDESEESDDEDDDGEE